MTGDDALEDEDDEDTKMTPNESKVHFYRWLTKLTAGVFDNGERLRQMSTTM